MDKTEFLCRKIYLQCQNLVNFNQYPKHYEEWLITTLLKIKTNEK